MSLIFRSSVRLHLTNVTGLGASQLLQSLLPALESDPLVNVKCIYLPDSGELANYRSNNPSTTMQIYHRFLSNVLSRFLECTILSNHFDGDTPLLVLGDLPLRCNCPQILFVQQSKLFFPERLRFGKESLKYWLSRLVFYINKGCVIAFIVQTELMREGIERRYPCVKGKVYVVPQPVPSWLLHSGLLRMERKQPFSDRLRLIYPAASYPHKNHSLLACVDFSSDWPIEELMLTISDISNPSPQVSWIKCVGLLSSTKMIEAYSKVDAVLFLSKEESYGFPLLEAMFVGLPIVCPNLPYARTLCGNEAIYFDADDPESLLSALQSLNARLYAGWWPNWQDRLVNVPSDWETVARRMLEIASNG